MLSVRFPKGEARAIEEEKKTESDCYAYIRNDKVHVVLVVSHQKHCFNENRVSKNYLVSSLHQYYTYT